MVAHKITLTDLRLKALRPAEAGKRYIAWDAVQPHLGVRVTDKGHRTFVVVRRRPGDAQPIFHVLGSYPALSLATARKRAAEALGTIEQGVHPAEVEAKAYQERERRQRDIFAAAVEAFLVDDRSRGLRTVDDTEAFLQREFLGRRRDKQASTWVDGPQPIWRDLPVAAIARRDVIARLDEIKRRGGKYAARHALAAVRKFFGWCADGERYGVEVSPCTRIRDRTLGVTGRDLKRKRVLDDAELRDVWQAAAGLGYPHGVVVQLLMITGQRLNDIAGARWTEIDAASVLTIPAERYKSGAPQMVPLSPRAAAILADLPRYAGGYIFTSRSGLKPIHGFHYAKQRLDAAIAERRTAEGREPMQPWVVHDIRRSVRTRLVGDCGVEAYIAERVIGHALPGLHGVYDQGTHLNAKRIALVAWERRLLSIVEPSEPAAPGVVPMEELDRRRQDRRP
jgi:integrase